MKRRLFLQTVLGSFALPIAGQSLAATVTSETIKLPPASDIISKFGFVTDVHYCVKPSPEFRMKIAFASIVMRSQNFVRRLTSLT